jgi:hypothetical protein
MAFGDCANPFQYLNKIVLKKSLYIYFCTLMGEEPEVVVPSDGDQDGSAGSESIFSEIFLF